MTKCGRRNHQPRHDLVTNAQINAAIKNIVRKRHPGAHRNQIPRKKRKLHAGLPLRDPVTHGGHATGHLRRATASASGLPYQLRIALKRLVGGKHIVIRGHNAEVAALPAHQRVLVLTRCRKCMGLVATGQMGASNASVSGPLAACQIARAQGFRAAFDALGHAQNCIV